MKLRFGPWNFAIFGLLSIWKKNGLDQKAIVDNTPLAKPKKTKHNLNVVWTRKYFNSQTGS